MRFSFALSIFLFLSWPFFAVGELPSRPRFAHESSDLRPDDRIRFGRLPNGLHYAILANREPRQRASLRLLVLAGSAHEEEDQQGLAHFVEHMAFNGTTHYEPGKLIEYFQRLGMSFGGDTNANTTFERTVYLLELPDTHQKTLVEACQVFADYANGELIKPSEVNSERGIILSEKRDRDSVEYRRQVAFDEFLLGQTLIPRRFPIGTAEVISKAEPERLRAYYESWYRPERMAVVAVGDFDPATVEELIKSSFAGITAAQPEPKEPSLGEIPPLTSDRILYRHETEGAETVVMAMSLQPYSREEDNRTNRLKYLPRDLALSMLNRRLSILARRADAPFIEGGVEVSENFDFYRIAGFQVSCKPEQWKAALGVGETELRRALEHGFNDAELKEAVANYRHSLEEAVKTAPTRRSESLANHLLVSLIEGYVFTTPQEELALYQPALDKVSVKDCERALRDAFPPGPRYLAVIGNVVIEPSPGPAADGKKPDAPAATLSPEEQILAVYQAAARAPVEAPARGAETAFAYTNFGAPGKVVAKKHVEDLDLDLLELTNGVKLNLKKTDFEANRVHVILRVGTGKLTEPRDKPGLSTLASSTFLLGGLGKHTIDDLIRLSAGRTGGLDFDVGLDALVLSSVTNREDLSFQLQVMTAFLTDAAYRPEALTTAHKNFEPMYQRLEHSPDGPLQLEISRALASGDPRFGLAKKEELFSRTLEEVRAWLEPQFKKGAMEISVVGDLDPAATVDAVNQTLGALPPRGFKPPLAAERRYLVPSKPFSRELTVVTEIPHGVVAVYWPSDDSRDIHRERRARLLADVFGDRLRVELREKLGDAYSPSAYHSSDEVFLHRGWFGAYIEVAPDKTDVIMNSTLQIAADLAEKGVTEEELERAKKPVLTSLRQSARTNSYWIRSVLQFAQELPHHLDWSRDRYADNEAISKADLDRLARECLAANRSFRVVVKPAK